MPTIAATTALILLLSAGAPASANIEGLWRNPIGSAIIRLAPCGRQLCGTVVWASARGKREASTSTPDIVGTTVLTGVKSTAANVWTGELFIPDDNVHVSATLQLRGDRELKLTGCALLGLFCRSQIWTRTAEPLPAAD